ncbi:MAG: TonB-dependent receptor, partial [Pedobacter sp.]
MNKKFLITLIFLLAAYTTLIACPVIFSINNKDKIPQVGIDIFINRVNKGKTNHSGDLEILLSEGNHTVELFRNGMLLLSKAIKVECKSNNHFYFSIGSLEAQNFDLDEIMVKSKSVKQKIEETPFSVNAIDLRKERDKGGDVSEILNRASGVKLRSDGNVGAPVQINLGGLQGKAVRLFKDGIPIELFGHGYSLGTIPVNMLDRIEVYKGVMPISLASDALGGGVNLITRSQLDKFAELSYEAGDFNTHRATLNAHWSDQSKKWYLGTNTSFNYSDNNYKVSVPVYDIQSSVTTYQNLPRFHDATQSFYTEAYVGVQNRRWANDLRVTLIASDFFKEIQHDAEMNKVYGTPTSNENNYTGILNYKKRLLNDRLNLNLLTSYSAFKTRFIDTATVRYGWNGEIIGRNQRPGEINLGNDQRIDYHFLFSRLNLSYQLSEKHALDFSEVYHAQNRKGTDPLGAISAIEGIDVLSVPANYRKNNLGLGLRSIWLEDKIESMIGIKYNSFNTKGYTTDNFGMGYRSSGAGSQLGYMGGLRWNMGNYIFKTSYEYANRLPDEYEVFGDARLVKENMDLKPEKSHNINLNVQYNSGERNKAFSLAAGLFYRKVQDIIFLQLDIPFSRYINYERAEVKGFEIETTYTPSKLFDFGGNITYQDIRRVEISETMFKNLEGSRIPNVPFLFGNFWLNTHFKNVFKEKDGFDLNWNGSYTHRFFLKAIAKNQEPGLFEKVKD